MLLAAIAGAPSPAASQTISPVFETAPALGSDPTAPASHPEGAVTRRRHATWRPGALIGADGSPRLVAGEQIGLSLFGDAEFTATITDVIRHSAASHAWTATIDGVDHGYAVLAVRDHALAGYLVMPGTVYRIGRADDGRQVIEQIDASLLPAESRPVVPPPAAFAARPESDAVADADPRIDVMVLYTAAARAAAGGTAGIQAEVSVAVASANQAYANSGLAQRLRLVHTGEVSIAESGDFDADLTALKGSAAVAALRDAKGADIVSLFTSNGPHPPSCGIGYLLTSNSPSFAPFAFNVVERVCASANLTFAHELGHHMGAHHDPYVAGSDKTVFPYSHGFVDQVGQVRTILAYNDQCAAARINCTRIPYFSSPLLTYALRALGNASTSDNALTLAQTASTVAGFRQALALSLGAGVNQPVFAAGQLLTVSIGITNPGLPGAADLYVGLVLPDGDTIVFFIGAGAVAFGTAADLASFRPIAAGMDLATPFDTAVPGFFSHQWTGSEPHGSYTFFVLATQAGALAGGALGADAILGVATTPFSVP